MKNFWPHRSKAKGFSIQNLAHQYRSKISSLSAGFNENSNQFLDDRNLVSFKEDIKNISNTNMPVKRIHWANRDFSEYKEAA